MKLKPLLATLLFIPLLCSVNTLRANHAAGGEIIYQHVSDSTYRIIFKFYRDCRGPGAPTVQPLCITDMVTGAVSSVDFDTVAAYGPSKRVQVSAGCSEYPTRCVDPTSTLPGYEEYWYSKVVTLTGHTMWKFSTFIGNRNASDNLAGGTNLWFYIETVFDNRVTDDNSSPYFSLKPIPYLCVNQPYSYNNGAIDIDGDSLVTDMVNPLEVIPPVSCATAPTPALFATATPPYNVVNNPLQTNNTFVINPASGQMNFTASAIGAYTITTRVREYRKGQLVGYIMRDVQVQVLNCSTTPPDFKIDPASVTNGSYTSNTLYGCIDQPLNFCYEITSGDTDAVLIAEDNHNVSIPGATVTYTGQLGDTIKGCVTWTPGSKDVGPRTFVVTTKDSTCKPPGIMLYYFYSVPIYIWPPTVALGDTTICPGDATFLTASGGGNFVWTVKPGGEPITSLSNPNIYNPIAVVSKKTTYVVTSTINNYCTNNTDEVTIDVLPGLDFSKVNDTITCPDNPVTLDLKINPPAGATYTMKWTPSTYLHDSTSDKPVVTPKATTTYTVILTSSDNTCKGYDTVLVDVLTGFNIENPDTAICNGQTVQVRATGDPRYTYSWNTTSPNPGVFSNATIIDPIITPAPLGKYKYILKASYPTCLDSISELEIDLQPLPVVTVGEDATVCYGDTMQLMGTVNPATYPFTLSWTPGASLNDPNIINPIFSANETTTLTFTATSSAGCTASDDMTLTVFPANFLFTSNDTAICPGNKVQLHLTGNGIRSFKWYPDEHISDRNSYEPFVSPTSTKIYTVIGIDTNACADTQNVKITVHPKVSLHLPDSVTLYPGQSYQLNPQGNAAYYSWFPPIGLSKADVANPTAKPDVNTRYYVNATTEFGCTASDSISILVAPESILSLPNAFSPGSQPNALLKVIRLGDATLKKFVVYNRWGTKVFETSDINEGWNGTYKNEPQPMGVYVYMIEATTASGKPFNKQGNVTLMR